MSKKWSLQQVAQHNTASSCWIIIENKVYDVTEFLPIHPGGVRLLLNFAGRDATAAFKPFHSSRALTDSLPPEKCLGEVDYVSAKALKKSRKSPRLRKLKDVPVTNVTPPSDDV
ncbi:cytochrome b5 [Laetiporus sulphureus 93-53]|uniref:Cytochrome b5 n=1 Tax=Laetiporus sulphureus 93-53 TaxID=1314785 RepID=A0A165B9Q9_9APHY|nr:cytochrome b5 [Laetiporus sulphureus 93-53]KZT00571.1 cytochrome b5 [Laetiporus sulphureus 93-53]